MICLETIHIIILLVIIIGLTTLFNYNTIVYNRTLNSEPPIIYINTEKQMIHKRDRKVLEDDFTAPERRVPEYQYPTKVITSRINIPSRGYPDEYQLLGNVFRNETETIYELFGRQKYPGSTQYEYYVVGSDNKNFKAKIPIIIQGDKEIENNQEINIPGTSSDKGVFRVQLFNYNVPRYIPSI
jgi:hypothetical protein